MAREYNKRSKTSYGGYSKRKKTDGDNKEKDSHQGKDAEFGKKKFGKSFEKRDFEKKFDDSSDKKPFFRKKYSPFDNKKFNKPFRKKAGGPSGNPHTPNTSGLIRLNKYISNAGICSRREADDLITSGAVTVNGKIITTMGYKVQPTDVVNYGGQTLRREKMFYVLLNKPKDYITTTDDPEKRKTVIELVRDACNERIYPVGRLDRATTGVLLLTNDGELTKVLTHPRYGVRKIYHVELDKALQHKDYAKIEEGITLEDGLMKVDKIFYVSPVNKKEIGIEIHSGKNRIVRRIFESLGYDIRKLDRVSFAGITKKDVQRSHWRYLSEKEVGFLRMIQAAE